MHCRLRAAEAVGGGGVLHTSKFFYSQGSAAAIVTLVMVASSVLLLPVSCGVRPEALRWLVPLFWRPWRSYFRRESELPRRSLPLRIVRLAGRRQPLPSAA